MKHLLLLVALILCSISSSRAQWVEPPMVEAATTLAGNGERSIKDFLVDDSGNIYATGYFHGLMCYGDSCIQSLAPDSADIFVCKLDSSLRLKWLKRIGGSGVNFGEKLSMNEAGQIILGVNFSGQLALSDTVIDANYPRTFFRNPTDFALLNVLEDGQLTLAYHPQGNSFKKLEHLESAYARTIISGEFASGAILFDDQNSDFDEGSPSERFFVELNTDWKVERDFQLIDWDQFPLWITKIRLDSSGIFLLGFFDDTLALAGQELFYGNGRRSFVTKLDTSGISKWIQIYSSSTFISVAINLDEKNNLYLSGETKDTLSWGDIEITPGGFLLKVSSSGKAHWTTSTFTPESWSTYRVFDILTDPRGIVTTGRFSRPLFIEDTVLDTDGSGLDGLILKHNFSTGEIKWAKQIGVAGSGNEIISKLSRGPSGAIYGIGSFNYNATLIDTVLLLNPVPGLNSFFFVKLSAEDFFSDPNPALNNWSVFPNPADDYLCIQGKWNNSSVSIELFDLQGKRVYHNETSPVSQDELLTFPLPSVLTTGVYLIRIQQGKQTRSYKIQVSHSFP